MEYQDNAELFGGCAGALIGAVGTRCLIGGLLVAKRQLLPIILLSGGALLLVSLLLRTLYTYLGPRGIICAVIALLVVGGLAAMGTVARFHLQYT